MDVYEISRRFDSQEKCISHLESRRWNGRACCVYCNSSKTSLNKADNRHHCHQCNHNFSVLVGTTFEDTKLCLTKWFMAIALVLHAKKGVSSAQLKRHLGVHKDTAQYLQRRLRSAMDDQGQDMVHFFDGAGVRRRFDNSRLKRKCDPRQGWLFGEKTRLRMARYLRGRAMDPREKEPSGGQAWMTTCRDLGRGRSGGYWRLVKRSIVGQFHHIHEVYGELYLGECLFKFKRRRHPDVFGAFLQSALGVGLANC